MGRSHCKRASLVRRSVERGCREGVQTMTDFERIDRATRLPAYREYSSLIGAAIARAAMAETADERKAALDDALALQAEQTQLVREAS